MLHASGGRCNTATQTVNSLVTSKNTRPTNGETSRSPTPNPPTPWCGVCAARDGGWGGMCGVCVRSQPPNNRQCNAGSGLLRGMAREVRCWTDSYMEKTWDTRSARVRRQCNKAQLKRIIYSTSQNILSNSKTQTLHGKLFLTQRSLPNQHRKQRMQADKPDRPSRLSSNTLLECYIYRNPNRHHTPCRNMYSRKGKLREPRLRNEGVKNGVIRPVSQRSVGGVGKTGVAASRCCEEQRWCGFVPGTWMAKTGRASWVFGGDGMTVARQWGTARYIETW